MGSLNNHNILFCVSGGTQAYQVPELIAALCAEGAAVSVVASPDAGHWVSLALLERLAGKEVQFGIDSAAFSGTRVVQVAEQLSDSALGWMEGLLGGLTGRAERTSSPTVFLIGATSAARFPLINSLGPSILPIEASSSLPRFDPLAMVALIDRTQAPQLLAGKRVLVTAGPTYEDIDPVRFLGNRSSGKMGFAVATAAWRAGGKVTLISGPVSLRSPHGVAVISVRSALEMLAAVEAVIAEQDVYISSAAVADYRPALIAPGKIKKGAGQMELSMVANPDLLQRVAARSSPPFCVGFAAETERVEEYARGKLVSKKLQLIAANQVGGDLGGFESDQNRLQLFWSGGQRLLPWSSKAEQARLLIEVIAQHYPDDPNGELS